MNTIAHDRSRFWVVTCISNPARYSSRYALYEQFKEQMREAGVNLFTVELQQGRREFAITCKDDPNALQLRTDDVLWHKEALLNLGVQRLPKDWKYVAWIDADISFQRKDWVEETLHQLQINKVVQLFQNAIDMGPTGQSLQIHNGFMYSYIEGLPFGTAYSFWHCGYAWACTKEAWNGFGGLLDTCILGSGDHSMALGLVGKAHLSYPKNISKGLIEDIHTWQYLAETHVKRDVGYVPGTILHHWHGPKRRRYYVERWKILQDSQFDPNKDLCRDWQGLYKLVGNKIQLRDDIRRYINSRSEDSIDL